MPYSDDDKEYRQRRRLKRPDPPEQTGLGLRDWMVAHYPTNKAGDRLERWEPLRYLAELADECQCAYESNRAESIVIWKGSQLGFSLLMVGFHAWLLLERHGKVLVVLPQDPMARKFYNDKLAPAYLHTPSLKRLVDANTDRVAARGAARRLATGINRPRRSTGVRGTTPSIDPRRSREHKRKRIDIDAAHGSSPRAGNRLGAGIARLPMARRWPLNEGRGSLPGDTPQSAQNIIRKAACRG